MLLVTNFEAFPARWTASTGESGQSLEVSSLEEFLQPRRDPDAVLVVNCDPDLVLQIEALFVLLPFLRRPLVAVDLVLRRPATLLDHLLLPLKRFLFSRVDHHILYFKDLSGYQHVFAIRPERSSYLAFKPNIRYRYHVEPRPDGDYALCLGRSLRDYDTFFAAMERLPYAGAIARPDWLRLRAHGARFTRPLDRLPPNVRLLDDDGSAEAQIRMLSGARLVVLPILKSNMVASGISTCLHSMLLGKCVIGSEGPGMSDVFTDEVLTVPPEDPQALAAVIRRAWEDDALRARTAAAGQRYAWALGGEPEFYQRVVDAVTAWYRTRA